MGTLNTRISLRYDTHENWSTASGKALVLNKGEIGICATHIGGANQPYIMFKVGDGSTPFEFLPWSAGLAADVYGWAKEAGIYIQSTEGDIVTDIAWDETLNNGKGGILVTKKTLSVEQDDYATEGVTTSINGRTLIFT
jgi:hypothetical protein